VRHIRIYSADCDLPAEAAYRLFALQHRGQESAGIAVAREGGCDYHKDMGLVSEVFKNGLKKLGGANAAIGHVDIHNGDSQPLKRPSLWYKLETRPDSSSS